MARTSRQSLKDLLDREVEKPLLEALYIQFGVATDQLRRAPEVLATITATFNRLTSRNFSQGLLLRYMINRRKNDGGDWPKLGARAKKFEPVSELLTSVELEALRRIYEALDVPSDEFLFRAELGKKIAEQFTQVTGRTVRSELLVAVVFAKRKRGEWAKIRQGEAFSDMDEVAKQYGTSG